MIFDDIKISSIDDVTNLKLKRYELTLKTLEIQKDLLKKEILVNHFHIQDIERKSAVIENIMEMEKKQIGEYSVEIESEIKILTENEVNRINPQIEEKVKNIQKQINDLQKIYMDRLNEFERYGDHIPLQGEGVNFTIKLEGDVDPGETCHSAALNNL
jgi:predicted  nucleic acid-binding Zn-ribbon protein